MHEAGSQRGRKTDRQAGRPSKQEGMEQADQQTDTEASRQAGRQAKGPSSTIAWRERSRSVFGVRASTTCLRCLLHPPGLSWRPFTPSASPPPPIHPSLSPRPSPSPFPLLSSLHCPTILILSQTRGLPRFPSLRLFFCFSAFCRRFLCSLSHLNTVVISLMFVCMFFPLTFTFIYCYCCLCSCSYCCDGNHHNNHYYYCYYRYIFSIVIIMIITITIIVIIIVIWTLAFAIPPPPLILFTSLSPHIQA